MFATKKSCMSRKWAWVRRQQNFVDWVYDKVLKRLCVVAPKQKNNWRLFFVDLFDNRSGEVFPTFVFVAVGCRTAHSKHTVQKKHSLNCPAPKVTILPPNGHRDRRHASYREFPKQIMLRYLHSVPEHLYPPAK